MILFDHLKVDHSIENNVENILEEIRATMNDTNKVRAIVLACQLFAHVE